MYVASRWMRPVVALAAATALFAATPQPADAAALLAGLGGARGYGTNYLPPNDDGSSGSIPITTAFPMGLRFFGMSFNAVFVNNNGNITFGAPLGTFTPMAFPVATQRMIAPWWGDVDTRAQSIPTEAGVFYDARPGQFTVTWSNVGYYSSHNDMRNDFQMILRSFAGCGIGAFDVEFRYNHCLWVTGDASGGTGGHGGTPAQAGFDGGDRVHFFALPGSLTEMVTNLCTTSNIGEPGVWRFRIRDGELPCTGQGTPCTTGMMGACAQGITECRGGMPVCTPNAAASTERCDGVDNDCNGMTDEGSMLCPTGQLCDRGSCVPLCVEGGCFEGQTCTSRGACVDDACISMSCAAGERCEAGHCVEACVGIRCPPPSVCRQGGCVVPCNGVMCDTGTACENGRCVINCNCRQCQTNYTCDGSSGTCVPADCIGMICPPGQYCRSALLEEPGSTARCQDSCTGASCPRGQVCMDGACIVGAPDAGGVRDAGDLPDSGTSVVDVVTMGDTGVSNGEGGTLSDGATRDGSGFGTGTRTGCACRTAGSTPRSLPWAHTALLLGLATVAIRRRRR